MPVWCPKCKAMLADGTEKCPACGAKMGGEPGGIISGRDILMFTLYILGIAMVPILTAMVLGLVCSLLAN